MAKLWIIDARIKLLPKNVISINGRGAGLSRSLVPGDDIPHAIEVLETILEEKGLSVVNVVAAFEASKNALEEFDEIFDTASTGEDENTTTHHGGNTTNH